MSVCVKRKACESDDLMYDQCRCKIVWSPDNSGLSASTTYYWRISTTYPQRLVIEVQKVLGSISVSWRVNNNNSTMEDNFPRKKPNIKAILQDLELKQAPNGREDWRHVLGAACEMLEIRASKRVSELALNPKSSASSCSILLARPNIELNRELENGKRMEHKSYL